MQSLPSKPWKKVKIEEVAAQRYRIVFVSDFANEAEFRDTIAEDIAGSLGPQDALDPPDWPSRSVVLTTPDLRGFKRNLVFACVMVQL